MADNKDAAKEEARRKIAERRAKRVGAAASAGGGPRAKRPARSQGDYLKQTSKPPSKLGKFIKVMLILITFVGVPAMIAASFFVKVGWLDSTHPTPERTIFNQFMAVVFPKKPAEPREDGGLVKKVTEPNPNIIEFRHLAAAMKNKQMELNGYRAILEKHDPATDWDKDELTDLLDKLEKARKEVIKMQEDLGRLSAWLIKFNEAKGRARDLFDKFQEFEKKKNAALIGVAHAGVNIPGEYAEEIQDPDVKQFVTICVLELEMHKYTDEVIQDASFTEVQRNAGSMMKGVNGMIGSLPSRDMIAAGQLGGRRPEPAPKPAPAPKPEPAPKPAPAPKPEPKPTGPAAVAAAFHPWASAKPGMWVRTKIDRNGDITYEDTIVRSVSAEGVVLYGLKTDGEEVVQVPESTLTFVEGQVQAFPDQEIEVAGTTRLCSVIKVGDRTTWVVKDGLGAGRVPAKVDQGGREIPVTKLEAASLKLKGEDRECVHYVLGGDMIWALAGVPGYVVKRVGLFDSREVVDWGADPDARPDFPKPPKPVAAAPAPKPKPAPAPKPAPKPEPAPKPAPEPAPAPKPAPEPEPAPKPAPAPKPPEKTPAQIIEEAKALVSKGVAAFKIVLVAMREPELPSEAEKLQALLAKSQEAATLLGQAREVYVSVQEKAPDPAGVGVTVGKLEKVLQTLKTYEEAIKSKM